MKQTHAKHTRFNNGFCLFVKYLFCSNRQRRALTTMLAFSLAILGMVGFGLAISNPKEVYAKPTQMIHHKSDNSNVKVVPVEPDEKVKESGFLNGDLPDPEVTPSNIPEHKHYWKPIYKEVVIKEAWDETVKQEAYYDEVTTYSCSVCHQDLTGVSEDERKAHVSACGGIIETKTEQGEYHPESKKIVHHPAEVKKEIDYYVCGCGERKES